MLGLLKEQYWKVLKELWSLEVRKGGTLSPRPDGNDSYSPEGVMHHSGAPLLFPLSHSGLALNMFSLFLLTTESETHQATKWKVEVLSTNRR